MKLSNLNGTLIGIMYTILMSFHVSTYMQMHTSKAILLLYKYIIIDKIRNQKPDNTKHAYVEKWIKKNG